MRHAIFLDPTSCPIKYNRHALGYNFSISTGFAMFLYSTQEGSGTIIITMPLHSMF
jgi:hypothetical protein